MDPPLNRPISRGRIKLKNFGPAVRVTAASLNSSQDALEQASMANAEEDKENRASLQEDSGPLFKSPKINDTKPTTLTSIALENLPSHTFDAPTLSRSDRCMGPVPPPSSLSLFKFESIQVNGVPYFLLKQIGQGATSKVYTCLTLDGSIYALKLINLSPTETKQSQAQALLTNPLQELEMLRKSKGLKHVIQLIDEQICDTHAYLVMEYGDIDLSGLMKQAKSMPLNFVQFYFNQVVESIRSLHEIGILHCDIKPSNFVLVKGTLKVIDFGISKYILDKHDMRVIPKEHQVGTVNYMAPEALNSYKLIDEMDDLYVTIGTPSDVWSLGCLLFEMATGKTPYAHLPMLKRVAAIMDLGSDIQMPLDIVPPALVSKLAGALRKSAKKRSPIESLFL